MKGVSGLGAHRGGKGPKVQHVYQRADPGRQLHGSLKEEKQEPSMRGGMRALAG